MSENRRTLQLALLQLGPIAVNMRVTSNFVFYKSGVFYDPTCHRDAPTNHAVLLVGYGKDEWGYHYWVVKNSWGQNWGENGYAKVTSHSEYDCGISSFASYPIL